MENTADVQKGLARAGTRSPSSRTSPPQLVTHERTSLKYTPLAIGALDSAFAEVGTACKRPLGQRSLSRCGPVQTTRTASLKIQDSVPAHAVVRRFARNHEVSPETRSGRLDVGL